jgi:crotonobetaine/carnitine-CoA ligase
MAEARIILIDEQYLPVLHDSEAKLPQLRDAVVFRAFGSPACDARPAFRRINLVPYAEVAVAGRRPTEVPVVFSDIASVIYTSGTTGPAKGVMMPHAQIVRLARQTIRGVRMTGEDVYYCIHPLFHMAGKFMAVFATLYAGGRIALDRTFAAESWLTRIREFGATVALAHGPMLEMIHQQPPGPNDADNPLRRIISVPLPKGIAHDFAARFDVRSIEVYGMTEINVVTWQPYDEPIRLGSCGKVSADEVAFRVIDPETDEPLPPGAMGEFAVRPHAPWTLMQGYKGMPEKTIEAWRNFWFHTGDLGYMDADGYVYFVDRVKDRIRRRAENISSYDIEAATGEHPAVLECAAIGVPSGFEADDDIKLCVVLRPDMPLEPEELLEHLVPRLPCRARPPTSCRRTNCAMPASARPPGIVRPRACRCGNWPRACATTARAANRPRRPAYDAAGGGVWGATNVRAWARACSKLA